MKTRNIDFYKIPQTVAVIHDWFTDDELELVWSELDVICSPYVLKTPNETGSTLDTDKKTSLKKGHGIFLDTFYGDKREVSHILNFNRKIFNKEMVDFLIHEDPNFNHLMRSNKDYTLVNYYEQGDEYKKHVDFSIFTSNVILWREPKQFEGGDFLIGEEQHSINIKSNDMVIFPGYTYHSVTPMTMHDNYTPWKSGRFSITNFCNYR